MSGGTLALGRAVAALGESSLSVPPILARFDPEAFVEAIDEVKSASCRVSLVGIFRSVFEIDFELSESWDVTSSNVEPSQVPNFVLDFGW